MLGSHVPGASRHPGDMCDAPDLEASHMSWYQEHHATSMSAWAAERLGLRIGFV